MEKTDVKEFLGKLTEDAEVQKLLKSCEKPESAEDMAAAVGRIAEKMGYDLSPEDIKSALEEAELDRKAKTDSAAEQIKELPDNVLDAVAGGDGHDNCMYSFEDKENCWFKDACDNAWPYYADYLCKRHNRGT